MNSRLDLLLYFLYVISSIETASMDIRITYIPAEPWVTAENHQGNLKFGGIIGNMYSMMEKKLRLNATYIERDENFWGMKLNNTWTGVIGLLHRQEIDVGIACFSITYERFMIHDFANVVSQSPLAILAGELESHQRNSLSYLSTYDYEVYPYFAGCLGVVLLFLVVSETLFASNEKVTVIWMSLYEMSSMLFATIFNESYRLKSRLHSSRTMFTFWLFSVMVLNYAFSGKFKATVIVGSNKDRINSIKDILKYPELTVYVMKGSSHAAYLKNSENPDFMRLWEKVKQSDGLVPVHDLFSHSKFQEVIERKSVIFGDYVTMMHYVSNACNNFTNGKFYFSTESYFPNFLTMPFRKNLNPHLVRDIRSISRRVFESGLVKKWVQDSRWRWYVCQDTKKNNENVAFGMEHVNPIFFTWIAGIFLSLITFTFEMLYHKRICLLNKRVTLNKKPHNI